MIEEPTDGASTFALNRLCRSRTRLPSDWTRATKNDFELAREGWRGTKSRRHRRGKRGEQAILGRAAGLSKPSRKLRPVAIVRGICRLV